MSELGPRAVLRLWWIPLCVFVFTAAQQKAHCNEYRLREQHSQKNTQLKES